MAVRALDLKRWDRLVASEIRAQMARHRVTQVDLSRTLGITQQAVSNKLRGVTPMNIDEVGRIADFLNVHIAVLFGVSVPDSPTPDQKINFGCTSHLATVTDLSAYMVPPHGVHQDDAAAA